MNGRQILHQRWRISQLVVRLYEIFLVIFDRTQGKMFRHFRSTSTASLPGADYHRSFHVYLTAAVSPSGAPRHLGAAPSLSAGHETLTCLCLTAAVSPSGAPRYLGAAPSLSAGRAPFPAVPTARRLRLCTGGARCWLGRRSDRDAHQWDECR